MTVNSKVSRSWLLVNPSREPDLGAVLATTSCDEVILDLEDAVAEGDKGYIQEISGVNLIAFLYLGAKHMVTGYDHILFLLGVIFFLYRLKDVGLYVTLFAVGHSVTLLIGVLTEVSISSVTAVFGAPVVIYMMVRRKAGRE